MRTVPAPTIRPHDDARRIAGRALGSLKNANRNITDSRAWYEQLRQEYSK